MRTRKSSGFTMIELLVVIAIIAILAAILFPIFAKARESGKRAACLGNMRQLGVGIRLYCEDYYGYTNPSYYLFINDNPVPVITGLQRYIPAVAVTGSRIGMVWQCASDTKFGFRGSGPLAWPASMSYGYIGGDGKTGRNLDKDSADPTTRGQVGFIVGDRRYVEDRLEEGWTFTPHARVYFSEAKQDGYINGLSTIRMMPDLHARLCQGWQRWGMKNAKGIMDYNLP